MRLALGWSFLLATFFANCTEHSFTLTPSVYHDDVNTVLDSELDVEVLATDIGWGEGPLWVQRLDSLLFSDIKNNKVMRWSEQRGLEVFLHPSGHNPSEESMQWKGANGLALDGNSHLILAQQGGRTLARMVTSINSPASNFEMLATHYGGKLLNSPNDLVIHQNGNIYFTDPPYGLDGFESSPLVELSFFGVFVLDKNGNLTLFDKTLAKPNGIALSNDNTTLLVTDSEPSVQKTWRYRLDTNGAMVDKTLFYDASKHGQDNDGAMDGLKFHKNGMIFATIPGGIALLSASGQLLAKIDVGFTCNLAFDTNYDYVYLTQPHRLLRIPLKN